MAVEGDAQTTPEQQRSDRRLLVALGVLAVAILVVGIVSGMVASRGEERGEGMIPSPQGESTPLPGDPQADPPPPPDALDEEGAGTGIGGKV